MPIYKRIDLQNKTNIKITSLRIVLSLWFLALSLFSVMLTAGLGIYTTRNTLIEQGHVNLQTASLETSRVISSYIVELEDDLRTMALYLNNSDISDDSILSSLRFGNLEMIELILTDNNGQIINTSIDFNTNPSAIKNDDLSYSNLYIIPETTKISLVTNIGPYGLSSEKEFYISVPINYIESKGVLIARYTLREVESVLFTKQGLAGKDSFPVILDKDGYTILKGGVIEGTLDDYNYVDTDIGKAGLSIRFYIKKKVVRDIILNEIKINFYGILFVAVLIVLISAYIARTITMPLSNLRDNFDRFTSEGHLKEIKNSEVYSDELRSLINSYNSLIEEIASKRELEERNRLLQTVLYSLHHDIRGPTHDIIFAKDLLCDILTPEQVDKLMLGDIVELLTQGTKKQEIILDGLNELLSLTKIDGSDFGEYNIKSVIQCLVENSYYDGDVQAIGEFPTLKINKDTFSVVLDNLIRNGLKYNQKHNKVIKIYDNGTSIVVEDNGDGFDINQLDKILMPFQRLQSDSKGTGLGLSIVNTIVNIHNFKLEADSVLGTGSKFYIVYNMVT